jgi:hypothetical protein
MTRYMFTTLAGAALILGSVGAASAAGSHEGGDNSAQPRVSRNMSGLPSNSQSSTTNGTSTTTVPYRSDNTGPGVTSGVTNGAPEANGAKASPAMPSNAGNGNNGSSGNSAAGGHS